MQVNKNPEYFLTVAEEKSISRAAEKLYLSQPYLSQHLLRLEKAFGVELFTRSPFRLTKAGEIYQSYLKSSQQMYQKLLEDLKDSRADSSQTIRLGFSNWRAGTLLPDVLPLFSEQHPDIRMEFYEVPNSGLYRLLAQNEVDFVLMNPTPDLPEYLTTETILYEKILLAGHRKNPVAERLAALQEEGKDPDLSYLENERVLMLPEESAIASCVRNYLASRQVILRNTVRIANASTALSLTSRNYGFCFLNETGVSAAMGAADMIFLPFRSEDMIHPLCAVYKKNSYLTPIARAFIDRTAEYYSARGLPPEKE